MQLCKWLNNAGIALQMPEIIATTGWTTDELLAAIEKAGPSNGHALVSLLIGVNNQYRGYPFAQYEEEFAKLLKLAIGFAGGRPERVFVVSIPNYGVTPFAADKQPDRIRTELQCYNQEAARQAQQAGVNFLNITPISEQAAEEPGLTAEDQLHPSAEMYRRWTEFIFPHVVKMLR
jgi:acyl-CoA thioesterase-1